ncbi:MAG TPA: sulfotransferase [Thermodesulfobacteriota bacterium]|nr:sulfotransferase [Thermodesulfobacteriota bacterium]
MIRCVKNPVIIIGMHRSGTTLVTRLAERLGLFVGSEVEDNDESVYFLSINIEILKRIGANWDNPVPARYFSENTEALDMTVKCVEADLSSEGVSGYMGPENYASCGGLKGLPKPWAWKDPRNTFTLPVWLKIFPEAKIIYVVRNGVDVAESLRVRERKEFEKQKEMFANVFSKLEVKPPPEEKGPYLKMLRDVFFKSGVKPPPKTKGSYLLRAGFSGSVRCLSLEGGFTLWEEYVDRAEETLSGISNERMVIKFENFIDDPKTCLAKLSGFCGLDAKDSAISEAAKSVKKERAYAFGSATELTEFYGKVRESRWMRHYGYSGLVSRGG